MLTFNDRHLFGFQAGYAIRASIGRGHAQNSCRSLTGGQNPEHQIVDVKVNPATSKKLWHMLMSSSHGTNDPKLLLGFGTLPYRQLTQVHSLGTGTRCSIVPSYDF
jgi:hypothetical protein